jgi:predicted  nucleic acid-binding Zn-ribbon protein
MSMAETRTLDELRDAYRRQIARLRSERDEARRQLYAAKADASVARADLARVAAKVEELARAAGIGARRGTSAETVPAARAKPVENRR